MRRFLLILAAVVMALGFNTAGAEQVEQRPGMDWEISMMPKPTEEEVKAMRWSIVLENDVGVYAYNLDSFTYTKADNGVPDKNIVAVLTKTLFTDKETLRKLNEKYKAALAKKERVKYCEIMMEFDLAAKAYRILTTDFFGSKDTLLDHKNRNAAFAPVPVNSFAEAMFEICQKAVAQESAQ